MRKLFVILVVALVLIVAGLLGNSGNRRRAAHQDEAIAHYEQGMTHLFAFQYPQAEGELQAALAIEPDFAMAATALAELHGRLGRREAYEAGINRADSLASLVENETERTLVQLWLSIHRESVYRAHQDSLFALAGILAPDDLIVLHAEVQQAQRSEDVAEQERIWRRILEVYPNYANAYNMLGYLEFFRGRYDEAIAHIQKYAYIAPDLANPHDSLGEMLMTMGRYEEAEKQFKKALHKQPDFYHSLINLGNIYIARGQLHKGVDILERVRSEVVGTELAMRIDRELIGTYFTNDLREPLDQATARYIAAHPEHMSSAFYRAMRLATLGRRAEAQAVMDSTLVAWRDLPEYAERPAFRREVESADEEFAAYIAEEKGDYRTAALRWEERLLQIASHAPHRLFHDRERYAAALIELGRYDEALDQLETVLAINPRLIGALVLVVKAHQGLGQEREARKYLTALEKALEKADADYPARRDAEELRAALPARSGNS